MRARVGGFAEHATSAMQLEDDSRVNVRLGRVVWELRCSERELSAYMLDVLRGQSIHHRVERRVVYENGDDCQEEKNGDR